VKSAVAKTPPWRLPQKADGKGKEPAKVIKGHVKQETPKGSADARATRERHINSSLDELVQEGCDGGKRAKGGASGKAGSSAKGGNNGKGRSSAKGGNNGKGQKSGQKLWSGKWLWAYGQWHRKA